MIKYCLNDDVLTSRKCSFKLYLNLNWDQYVFLVFNKYLSVILAVQHSVQYIHSPEKYNYNTNKSNNRTICES